MVGQPARPWLTVILDDRSRALAGCTVSLDAPSALQTALALGFDIAIDECLHPTLEVFRDPPERSYVELLIIDEADRVKTTVLEALRDFFDRRRIGLILTACPG